MQYAFAKQKQRLCDHVTNDDIATVKSRTQGGRAVGRMERT